MSNESQNRPAINDLREMFPQVRQIDESSLSLYHGPLPSVEELAEYSALSPDLAEQIIAFHRDALVHEQQRLDRAFRARERNRSIAVVCTFVLALFTGYSGIDALAQGDTATGLTLSGGSLSAVGIALWKAIEGCRSQKKPPSPS